MGNIGYTKNEVFLGISLVNVNESARVCSHLLNNPLTENLIFLCGLSQVDQKFNGGSFSTTLLKDSLFPVLVSFADYLAIPKK